MVADLLERDHNFRTLHAALCRAIDAHGQVALVSGEAGIGKTSLVERFIEQRPPGARVLWGACEALFTPRPLGPLYDMAQQAHDALQAALDGEATGGGLFALVLNDIASGAVPAICVIEDIHWADEATLDLIKYLGRRIHHVPVLLILTYRDDEIGKHHPLRQVLGDLPARDTVRLHLLPLSEETVTTLARQANRLGKELYLATGGNPFFVSEALAAGDMGIPTSVSDMVLGRAARLSAETRELLDMVAIAPTRLERWMLESWRPSLFGLEECLEAGLLVMDDTFLSFRHELARQAIEDALSAEEARRLHRQALALLLRQSEHGVPMARLVHHALHAGDAELTLRFAPLAAQEAAAQRAHREAAAHYRTALRYAAALGTEQRAELLERLSYECYLTSQMEQGVRAREEALAIWRALNKPDKVGQNLRRLSRLYWFLGRKAEADQYAQEALAVLETLPPDSELAMAYSNCSQLYMLADQTEAAQLWGRRAIELAERLEDPETLCHALNNVGSAELNAGNPQGREKLERSLRLALEYGFEEHVARAYTNLAEHAVMFRDYAWSSIVHEEGIAYCVERDLDSWSLYLRGWRARQRFEQGDWVGAEDDAVAVVSLPHLPVAIRLPALVILGWVRVRRGDPGVWPVLDEARMPSLETGELQRIAPLVAARAEALWLEGNADACLAETSVGFELARGHRNPWAFGELASWMWRVGAPAAPPQDMAAPYVLQFAGDWRGAAEAWETLGCPYERALTLLDGDASALQEALEIARHLGADPLTRVILRRLRRQGVRGVPRGPRPSTQRNPAGLTNREVELLALVAEGFSNGEIAVRLSISAKTVEHHMTSAMGKLGAHSRAQAIASAYRLGALTPPEKSSAK
jgi:DNA-binding CsgD family transcriptional regulator/tetratricopeptide (TPR) repeat protein